MKGSKEAIKDLENQILKINQKIEAQNAQIKIIENLNFELQHKNLNLNEK